MKLDFKYTNELVTYLLNIEKYKTALEYLYLPTRTKQKLMYDAKLKKTHFSTSIEGNVLSLKQVENVIKQKNQGNKISAEEEVHNYWDALTFLEVEKEKNTPLSKDLIFRLHDIIEKNGKLKRIGYRGATPLGVLFAVYDDKTKLPEYIPPEWCDVEPLIEELINWYHSNQQLPAPILAAITSYAFVSIHPFANGNGRTSRALATYILMIKGYDFKGFNSFEEYYMSDLDGYYSSLQMGLPALFYDGRENPPHLEIWLEYFCKIMSLNSENIYYQAKEASNRDTNKVLNGLLKKDLVLIRYCLENNIKIIKNSELATLFGVTSRCISKWAVEWCNKGILVQNSGTTRITSYKLSNKYSSLKISDIGFID